MSEPCPAHLDAEASEIWKQCRWIIEGGKCCAGVDLQLQALWICRELRQESRANEERARRLYYQDIVYHVCNVLDRLERQKGGKGVLLTICGTVDSPSRMVQERMDALSAQVTTQPATAPA